MGAHIASELRYPWNNFLNRLAHVLRPVGMRRAIFHVDDNQQSLACVKFDPHRIWIAYVDELFAAPSKR